MGTLHILAVLLAMSASGADQPRDPPPPAPQAPGTEAAPQAPGSEAAPPVQRGPEVSGSEHDRSPPLRDVPPAEHKPGHRVHPWRRIPRPPPGEPATGAKTRAGEPEQAEPQLKTRKRATKPPHTPRSNAAAAAKEESAKAAATEKKEEKSEDK